MIIYMSIFDTSISSDISLDSSISLRFVKILILKQFEAIKAYNAAIILQ